MRLNEMVEQMKCAAAAEAAELLCAPVLQGHAPKR
jgi:hypothetical protein